MLKENNIVLHFIEEKTIQKNSSFGFLVEIGNDGTVRTSKDIVDYSRYEDYEIKFKNPPKIQALFNIYEYNFCLSLSCVMIMGIYI